ncbi:S-layer homology domain-containing protein [Lysinibacillus antri]|uniref:S-layer homology domain-containing protein n=2 Tax=Lysinibacillus antri TaxID=2498145 RepID=A0A3S0RUE7_9BACI|nr:S-layer homology domain-containing protein [Lysinibacillus antri]
MLQLMRFNILIGGSHMKLAKLFPSLVAFLLIFALSVPKVDAAFKDVRDTYWASDIINEFVEAGIISGYEDETFRPGNTVTREQAAIIISRALKLDTTNVKPVNYSDIKESDNAYKAIATVTNAGIMIGVDGKFEPKQPITRVQLATILTKSFDLKGNGTSLFKDVPKNHSAYNTIDALYANKIALGYTNGAFKPEKPTTRAEFIAFLDRALNLKEQNTTEPETETENESESVADLLKEVYANEQNLSSYEFNGKMNLGILFPESAVTTPEDKALFDMLKDINVEISGAYQKDPMHFEANIDVTIKGDVQTTFTIPMVMTEDKIWVKLPNSPLLPLPQEFQGKFIELNLQQLTQMAGQPSSALDMNLQTKLGMDIINLFVDLLGNDFYKEVALDSVVVPTGVEGDKVIKFEVTNETLKPFVNVVFNELLPQMFELIAQNPEYVKALGFTPEDIALTKDLFSSEEFNLDEVVSEINKFLTINQFDEHIVITQDNYIGYDVVNVDITMTMEGETLGLKLFFDQSKSKVNEQIKFPIGIPSGDNVIPFEKLMEMEQQALNTESK